MKTKWCLICSVLLLAVSCKDEAPETLVLHTPQQEDNSIVLNWEQSGIAGFQYYAVMRASDGQNYEIINDVINPASDAFRKEITTFTDNTYPVEVDTLYYKIMAVGDETVVSENVLFRNKNKAPLLTGEIWDMYFVEGENKISMVAYSDYGNYHQLKVYDLESGQFLPDETSIYLSSSCSWLLWGHYNGKTEAYHYSGNNTIFCYDAATTNSLTTINIPYFCYNPYTTNQKGMIYIANYYLYLIDRATGNYTHYQLENQIWADFLYYNSKDNKLYVTDNSYGRIITLHLNEDGSVANEDIFTISGNNSVPVYIENSALFIVNINGQMKILDMNTQTCHSTGLTNSYYYYETKAVMANNNIYITNGTNKITKMSAADYSAVQTITLRTSPKKIFVGNGYLYYFGQYQYNNCLLDKIKL